LRGGGSLTGRRTKLETRRAESGDEVLGEEASTPHQLMDLGERCKLPQQGPGRSPGKIEIRCNLRPQT